MKIYFKFRHFAQKYTGHRVLSLLSIVPGQNLVLSLIYNFVHRCITLNMMACVISQICTGYRLLNQSLKILRNVDHTTYFSKRIAKPMAEYYRLRGWEETFGISNTCHCYFFFSSSLVNHFTPAVSSCQK